MSLCGSGQSALSKPYGSQEDALLAPASAPKQSSLHEKLLCISGRGPLDKAYNHAYKSCEVRARKQTHFKQTRHFDAQGKALSAKLDHMMLLWHQQDPISTHHEIGIDQFVSPSEMTPSGLASFAGATSVTGTPPVLMMLAGAASGSGVFCAACI